VERATGIEPTRTTLSNRENTEFCVTPTIADAMHQTTKVAGTAFDSGQSTPALLGRRAEAYAAIAIRVHDSVEKM
jgi:hypothetical protein